MKCNPRSCMDNWTKDKRWRKSKYICCPMHKFLDNMIGGGGTENRITDKSAHETCRKGARSEMKKSVTVILAYKKNSVFANDIVTVITSQLQVEWHALQMCICKWRRISCLQNWKQLKKGCYSRNQNFCIHASSSSASYFYPL